MSRELGVVAVVGIENATETIKEEQKFSVSCAGGNIGKVFEGYLEWEEEEIDFSKFNEPETEVMLILANPKIAYN